MLQLIGRMRPNVSKKFKKGFFEGLQVFKDQPNQHFPIASMEGLTVALFVLLREKVIPSKNRTTRKVLMRKVQTRKIRTRKVL